MTDATFDPSTLNSIFHECRQCGCCCKSYRKIPLQADEVEFIEKMGGHVGIPLTLADLREGRKEELLEKAKKEGKIYMIHPDDKGCVFMVKRNDKYICKIYNYRPRVCRGFKCNLSDSSFHDLFASDATGLLGLNSFGLPLENE